MTKDTDWAVQVQDIIVQACVPRSFLGWVTEYKKVVVVAVVGWFYFPKYEEILFSSCKMEAVQYWCANHLFLSEEQYAVIKYGKDNQKWVEKYVGFSIACLLLDSKKRKTWKTKKF